MRSATLTQFLIDITRGHLKDAYVADPAQLLATSALDGDLRAAVLASDIGTLWLAGAHPMALMYFARSIGWANDRYYRCITEAELTKAASTAAAAPPAAPAPSRTHPPSAPHAQ